MGRPNSTDGKLDLIIDSIQEIKDMRKDVISLVEWKNSVNEKIEDLENSPHNCLKSSEIASLQTSVVAINKWKWWLLSFFIMLSSTLITFSINLSKDYVENKSNIASNKENIGKIDRQLDRLNEEHRRVD